MKKKKILSLFLIAYLLFLNSISYGKNEFIKEDNEFISEVKKINNYDNDEFLSKEDTKYIYETYSYKDDYEKFYTEKIEISNEKFVYIAEDYIYEKYNNYLKDVHIIPLVNIQDKKTNNILVIDNEEINLNKIFKNLAIGLGAIIIFASIAPVVAISAGTTSAAVTSAVSQTMVAITIKGALSGAVLDGVINGIIEYIKTGDLKKSGYKALEGASEGFKWGAILTAINSEKLAFDKLRKVNHYAPNTTYIAGEHNYFYQTDSMSRIVYAEGILKPKRHVGRLKYNSLSPDKLIGDDAGHLIADRFGGSPELDNILSQVKNLNRKTYKKLENIWAKEEKKGKLVRVSIAPIFYGTSKRPYKYNITYFIDGVIKKVSFLNK